MAPLTRLIFLISLLIAFVLAAPIPVSGNQLTKAGRLPLHVRASDGAPVSHKRATKVDAKKVKKVKRSTATIVNSDFKISPLPFLKRFIQKVKRATPAEGLDASALGKCSYVGGDFLTHDCNELLDVESASLNAARTPEQKKIVADFTAKLIAEGKLAPAS